MSTQKAMFAAGCFWGVEAKFREIKGVLSTAVGYSGGTVANPTYEQVCTDRTGHAEVVEIEFDPAVVSYDQLLKRFWEMHDPTTLNRQGPDVGTQYRSAIFFYSPEQEKEARASKAEFQTELKNTVVTEISPVKPFYRAEEYHQCYLEKKGLGSCH